jgi:hypothetical protein
MVRRAPEQHEMREGVNWMTMQKTGEIVPAIKIGKTG